MVHPVGFEPTTNPLEGDYSIQLNYGCLAPICKMLQQHPVLSAECTYPPDQGFAFMHRYMG